MNAQHCPTASQRCCCPRRLPQIVQKCCVKRRCSGKNYYDVLEVSTDATPEEIKASFRRKAKLLHPDVSKAPDADQAFRLLRRAHDVLSVPQLRLEHDSQLGLPSARATDPRFARFERWRREVVPDLRMQLDVWTAEIQLVLSTAEDALFAREQECRQLKMAQQCCSADQLAEQEALLIDMRSVLQDAVANVQRLYDKRYQQVEVRYPAYPDIVWYDVWLEISDTWLAESGKLERTWQQRIDLLQTAVAV